MKHSTTILLQAINLAGNQTKLANILKINNSQLSAWLSTPGVNMPVKYGDIIEAWSKGNISKRNLFPELRDIPLSRELTDLDKIQALIDMAKESNQHISVHISLDTISNTTH